MTTQQEIPTARINVLIDNRCDTLKDCELQVTLLKNGAPIEQRASRFGANCTGAWNVPPGPYEVRIEADGAVTQVKGLNCGADKEVAVHFSLLPGLKSTIIEHGMAGMGRSVATGRMAHSKHAWTR